MKDEKQNLEQSIAYSEGSVVSKQLISRDTGSATLFAFAWGEGLSEHTAPFDAMVYILDGKAKIGIAKEEHHLEAGEYIIMPAHVPHALHAETAFKMLLVMIKG
jgi:quercetin dioxygenase-like cupin family protein